MRMQLTFILAAFFDGALDCATEFPDVVAYFCRGNSIEFLSTSVVRSSSRKIISYRYRHKALIKVWQAVYFSLENRKKHAGTEPQTNHCRSQL
jgi:hypothetical protein